MINENYGDAFAGMRTYAKRQVAEIEQIQRNIHTLEEIGKQIDADRALEKEAQNET